MHAELLGEEVCSTDTNEWHLTFNGSSTHREGGAPNSTSISVAYKLDFPYTNNGNVYEAFVIGLAFALKKGIRRLKVQGHLRFIIKQINGDFELKEIGLVPYQTIVRS